jgi:hypothetical protein
MYKLRRIYRSHTSLHTQLQYLLFSVGGTNHHKLFIFVSYGYIQYTGSNKENTTAHTQQKERERTEGRNKRRQDREGVLVSNRTGRAIVRQDRMELIGQVKTGLSRTEHNRI